MKMLNIVNAVFMLFLVVGTSDSMAMQKKQLGGSILSGYREQPVANFISPFGSSKDSPPIKKDSSDLFLEDFLKKLTIEISGEFYPVFLNSDLKTKLNDELKKDANARPFTTKLKESIDDTLSYGTGKKVIGIEFILYKDEIYVQDYAPK